MTPKDKASDGVEDVDVGGNRPMDYISLEEHDAAEATLKEKSRWAELNQNEVVVLRSRARQLGPNKDIVFKDKLELILCIFYHCENRDQWMNRATEARELVGKLEKALARRSIHGRGRHLDNH